MEKQEKIQILQDLIKINTVNGNEAEVANYIAKLFDKHGIKYEILEQFPGRSNLVAEIGQKTDKRILGFTGHQDTVAVSDETKWTHNPFSAEIVGDKVFGRGAGDMKSGLAAIIVAIVELVDAGTLPTGTLRFIATVGEEYGAPGAYYLTEKGYAHDLDALLVGEPHNGNVTYAHCGSFNYRIKSYGKSVHSSVPETGINSLTNLVKYINVEEHLFDDAKNDDLLGGLAHSVTVLHAGDQVNSIPDYAYLDGNIRPTKVFNNEMVIEHIKDAVKKLNEEDGVQLEFEVIHNFYPMSTDPNSDFVKLVAQKSEKYFGRKPELTIDHGATDASVFVQDNTTMPVVIFGPDSDRSHQIDEFTTIPSYLDTIEALKAVALDYFN